MSLAITITYVAPIGNGQIRVGFNIAPSGNYVPGGDTVNLATASQDPLFVGSAASVEALGAPLNMDIWDCGGGIKSLVSAILGTNPSNGKMKVATALNTEAGTVAYSGLGFVTLVGEAVFNKL
jgi:hypothetical protein